MTITQGIDIKLMISNQSLLFMYFLRHCWNITVTLYLMKLVDDEQGHSNVPGL